MVFRVWGGVGRGMFIAQGRKGGNEERRENGSEGGGAQRVVSSPERVHTASRSPLTGLRRKI